MVLGNVIVGMGVSIFKLSCLGNDAYNAMTMALADFLSIPFGHFSAMAGILMFLVQIVVGRKYIGIGTVVNSLLSGYIVSFFYNIWMYMFEVPSQLPIKLVIMVLGVVACGLGLSMYQMADTGISPYDSYALIIAEKCKKIPYFWWRMLFDGSCALIAFLAGGLLGIGTIVCAFGLGPCIQFFNVYVTGKLLKKEK